MASYSRLAVCVAGQTAADLFHAADLDVDTVTIIDFMVNATITMLDNPDAGIEDVIREHWGDDPDDADAIRKLFTTNGQEPQQG